jgi:hypothetical protein
MTCTKCIRRCGSLDIAALLLGFDCVERALGFRGCDPVERCPERFELSAQLSLAVADPIDLRGQCERIGAGHRSTPQDS